VLTKVNSRGWCTSNAKWGDDRKITKNDTAQAEEKKKSAEEKQREADAYAKNPYLGHAILHYASGGKLLTAMTHWSEMKKLKNVSPDRYE
jgi:hypothetical protein